MSAPSMIARGPVSFPSGSSYRAVLFDMDGVITDTASVHARAWQELFDAFLRARASGASFVPFDLERDYRAHVDGRARQDGVVTFLASRGIDLPAGSAGDGADGETVWRLADRKNAVFARMVAVEGVSVFSSAVDLVRRLRAAEVPTALVTASRNAVDLLGAAGLTDLFDVVVDGLVAESAGLAGKPDPAAFLEAARRLQLPARDCVVVEDAVSGVLAGARGGFGLVIGVDRDGSRAGELTAAGAHRVVRDLAELDDLLDHVAPKRVDESWRLVFPGFVPALEGRREALCATANGYLGSRGAAPECRADGVHYPGTYLAGCYNRLTSQVDGSTVEDEHLVNAPNWLPLRFRGRVGTWFEPSAPGLLDHTQELDLRRGVLSRALRSRDAGGQVTRVRQQRFVSMADPHLAVLRTWFTAEGWSGRLTVRSALDGEVVNGNVLEYALLANRHLLPVAATHHSDHVDVLEVSTVTSALRMALAARTCVPGRDPVTRRLPVQAGSSFVATDLELDLVDGQEVVVEKVVAVATSRDRAMSSPRLGALAALARAGDVDALLVEHAAAWERLWQRFGVHLDTDDDTRRAVHLHLFHVLQTLSPHLSELDAGVPVRGLRGEGYRGHVFWDEVLVFPLLTLRQPELSRSLLMYRFRRLGAARDAARADGRPGAMFPWQSGSDGREETPTQLFNVRSGRWMPDHSRLQRHVGIEVAFSVWQYYQATGDTEFLIDHGAEMIVGVALYLSSLAVHDSGSDRFSIPGVMGPDEYHDAYPGAATAGLRDNAYTNVMTAWLLGKAAEVVGLVACEVGAHDRLGVSAAELARWEHISRRLHVAFHADGVISQFDGYEQLAEFDWDGYRRRYGNIGRLDLILAAEGDTTNRYRLSKQADVLMLLYLLSAEELRAVLERLGYDLPADAVRRTVEFYAARVAHGSTLCHGVHAWVLARADRESSWPSFREALRADSEDTQGGTTREGIHLAAMAGTVDLLQRGYTGLELRDDTMWLNPRLPREIDRLGLSLRYRGHQIALDVDHQRVRVSLSPCAARPVQLSMCGTLRSARAGETIEFPVTPGRSHSA